MLYFITIIHLICTTSNTTYSGSFRLILLNQARGITRHTKNSKQTERKKNTNYRRNHLQNNYSDYYQIFFLVLFLCIHFIIHDIFYFIELFFPSVSIIFILSPLCTFLFIFNMYEMSVFPDYAEFPRIRAHAHTHKT